MEEVSLGGDEGDDDTLDVSYDSFDDEHYERPAERWAPLGAAAQDSDPGTSGGCIEHRCLLALI